MDFWFSSFFVAAPYKGEAVFLLMQPSLGKKKLNECIYWHHALNWVGSESVGGCSESSMRCPGDALGCEGVGRGLATLGSRGHRPYYI